MSLLYSSLQLSRLTVTTLLVIISIQIFTIAASSSATRTTKNDDTNDKRKKIAIIGSGIGGTFSAKYLTDYDVGCDIHSITIFSPPLVGAQDDKKKGKTVTVQGSRVKSLRLKDDGTVVELGASVIFEGNRYASEMMNATDEGKDIAGNEGGELLKVKPFSPGKKKESSQTGKLRDGLGVFNGGNNPSSRWPLYTAGMSPSEIRSTMIWRYNLDLKRINIAATNALSKFDKVYKLLESTHTDSFVNSPESLWDAVGLGHLAQASLEDHLDDIGVDGAGSSGLSWWRKVLGWGVEQGLFRHELFEAINLCNNGKDNSKMTALAGLVNFVSSVGPLFAIEGGNDQLMPHALKRASSQRQKACSEYSSSASTSSIIQIHQQIQTVISKSNAGGFELFAPNSVPLGTYDILILAAPFQFANINFLVHGSLFDPDLLSPMPLNGLVQNEDHSNVNANHHEHRAAFGSGYLPDSAKRGYTKVVTTVVSNAVLNPLYFEFNQSDGEEKIPRSILTTTKGQAHLHITSVGQITPDTGVYKIFSPHELPPDRITRAFGPKVIVEHVEVWGGERGGATPDFNGGRGTSATSAQFLLYDGDLGIGNEDGKSENDRVGGTALYYVNAMEASVSAIEISAIGAKAVAKLVAKRLGLITPTFGREEKEEL